MLTARMEKRGKKYHGRIEQIEKHEAVYSTRYTNQQVISLLYHIIIHSGSFKPLFEMQIQFLSVFSFNKRFLSCEKSPLG